VRSGLFMVGCLFGGGAGAPPPQRGPRVWRVLFEEHAVLGAAVAYRGDDEDGGPKAPATIAVPANLVKRC
jgi:hypothetical protein